MDVFTLAAKLSLDSKGFAKDLQKQESGFKKFGDKLEAGFGKIQKAAKLLLSGVVVKKAADAVSALVSETASMGDKIDKQSQALGLSRKAYQEWDYILSQSGASIDSMGVSMKTLNNAILSGGKETSNALKDLGLSAEGLKDLSQEQAFEKVVRAFQQLPAGAEKSALAVKLFGRNGQDLLPLLNSDIYSIDMLRLKAKDLGLIMSDEAVNASVKYTDSLDTLQRTFNGLKYSIGSKVLPALTRGFENLTKYASKIRRAYESNGLSGVFRTLVNDIKNINWPTWDDVWKAATDAWNGIKAGVANLGGLIFGKNEKGEVNWPSFGEAVEWARVNIWEGVIKKGVKEFGGLVFGKDEEGKVNWPNWGQIIAFAGEKWNYVIGEIKKLPPLIFGEDSVISNALQNVFSFLKDFGGWILSDGDAVAAGLTTIIGVITFKKLAGLAAVNPLLAGIAAGALLVVTNWDLVKQKVEELRESLEEIEKTFEPINDFFLQLQGGGNSALIAGQVADLSGSYQKVKALERVRGRDAAEEYFKGTWLKNFEREMKSAGFSAEQIETALSKISLDMTQPEMNNFLQGLTDAQKASETLKETVEGVAGDYDVNFHINVDGNIPTVNESAPTNRNFDKSREGSFAKGAWDIPYDNFRATLHRNEMVLTASQARRYRDGSGGDSMSGLLSAIQGMRNDLKNLTIQVDGKDFGRAVVAYGSQGVKNYIGGTNKKAQAGYGT